MRRSVVSILALAWVLSAGATLSKEDPVLQHLRLCENESNDAARLTCYDLAIGRTQQEKNDDIGVTGELLRAKRRQAGMPETPPQRMRAKVVAVTQSPTGKFTVTLDNGQAWAQQELLEFPIEVGDEVTVRSGLLGALWMIAEHRNRQTRVLRIQ